MDTFTAVPEPNPGDLERFMRYVRKEPSGCWTWTGGTRGKGYGAFWLGGTMRAHRVIYAWTFGDPGPVELHHACQNPGCVNPDHLKRVISEVHPHHRNPDRGRCAQGHEFSDENTGHSKEGWRFCKQCARDKARRYATQNRETVLAKKRAKRVRVVHEPRVCFALDCDKLFTPTRDTGKYCSNSCLQRYNRLRRLGRV